MAKRTPVPPAELIAARFESVGIGVCEVSTLLGMERTWLSTVTGRGGEFAGSGRLRKILRLARAKNVPLTADEVINGGVP